MSFDTDAIAAVEHVRNSREPRKRRWNRVPDLSAAPDELLLAPSEVSALSGIAEITLYVWRKKGRGPAWLCLLYTSRCV